jgi:hypothetical protein
MGSQSNRRRRTKWCKPNSLETATRRAANLLRPGLIRAVTSEQSRSGHLIKKAYERGNPMNKTKCLRSALAGLALSLMTLCTFSTAKAEECEGTTLTASLMTLNNSGVTGTAKLCISEGGVHTRITANNLTPGNPYTVWFVYFDDPSKCLTPGHCTSADTVTPARPRRAPEHFRDTSEFSLPAAR